MVFVSFITRALFVGGPYRVRAHLLSVGAFAGLSFLVVTDITGFFVARGSIAGKGIWSGALWRRFCSTVHRGRSTSRSHSTGSHLLRTLQRNCSPALMPTQYGSVVGIRPALFSVGENMSGFVIGNPDGMTPC